MQLYSLVKVIKQTSFKALNLNIHAARALPPFNRDHSPLNQRSGTRQK